EKNKKEIELKDVDHELLDLIYPSGKKITDANAESVLKLADRFQIKVIIDQAEQFFIHSSELDVPCKLKLSDQYRLANLQNHCVGTFKTLKDIHHFSKSPCYKELSVSAKAMLMDKWAKFK
ncbi:hypothetical protein PMAYCL1PPCAC_14725, partial [Pristionchus mayeri]